MISNDELTIGELFDLAADQHEKLRSNQIDGHRTIYDDLLDRLRLIEEKIDELHLFSDNEDINEISSNELRLTITFST
jgi:hypothetical protein